MGQPEGLSRAPRPAPHGSSPERPAARRLAAWQARSTPAGPRRGLTSALEASPLAEVPTALPRLCVQLSSEAVEDIDQSTSPLPFFSFSLCS